MGSPLQVVLRGRDESGEVQFDFEPGRLQLAPGTVELVTQHDGSVLKLSKLPNDFDPTDKLASLTRLQTHHANGEILTGLIYVDPEAEDLHQNLGTVPTPLNALEDQQLIPGAAAFARPARRGRASVRQPTR